MSAIHLINEKLNEIESMFKLFNAVELEIGAGKGRFILDRAKKNPDTLFFAVEIRKKYSEKIFERKKNLGVENLVVINDDIKNAFVNIFKNDSIFDRIFMNFPDPWWKRRHQKRSLASEEMLEKIARVMKKGGEIFIQTDVMSRASAILSLLTDSQFFENISASGGFYDFNPFGSMSEREEMCHKFDVPIFRIYFRKI